jgi:hypothetical protein
MAKGAGRKTYTRISLQQVCLQLQTAGMGDIIPIHAGYEGGAAGGQPLVEGRNQTASLAPHGAYARVSKCGSGQD